MTNDTAWRLRESRTGDSGRGAPSMLSPIAPTKPYRARMGNANDTGHSMSLPFAPVKGVWELRVGKEGANTDMRQAGSRPYSGKPG